MWVEDSRSLLGRQEKSLKWSALTVVPLVSQIGGAKGEQVNPFDVGALPAANCPAREAKKTTPSRLERVGFDVALMIHCSG